MYLDLQSGPTYQLQVAICWTRHHLHAVVVEVSSYIAYMNVPEGASDAHDTVTGIASRMLTMTHV